MIIYHFLGGFAHLSCIYIYIYKVANHSSLHVNSNDEILMMNISSIIDTEEIIIILNW